MAFAKPARGPNRSRRDRLIVVLVVVAVCGFSWFARVPVARADGPTSPQGNQRVLVIPVEFPSCTPGADCSPSPGDARYCPNASLPCPAGPCEFRAPRHTPAQWESIYDSTVTPFWSTGTYGQTNLSFTVLSDPATSDGWFPAPHPSQLYQKGNWYLDKKDQPPYLPYAGDVASAAIDTLCSNPIEALVLNCGTGPTNFPHNYDRLVIVNNWQGFGGQTYGGNGETYDIPTKKTGTLSISASVINESFSDRDNVAVIEHELGHQLGAPAHYGDCAFYPPPFAGGTGQDSVDCLGNWDIMSWTGDPPSSAMLNGYPLEQDGWIPPNLVVQHDLIDEGAFTDSRTIAPLEVAPSASQPNLIQLSLLPLDWPEQLGYDIECRERVGVDQGDPTAGSTGIPSEGLVVTNVHSSSPNDLLHPAPPVHVVRSLSGYDHIDQAMQPGDVFDDNTIGLHVRFDGYVNDASIAPARLCRVTVSNQTPLPFAWAGLVAQSPLQLGVGGSGKGQNAPIPDLGLDAPLAPVANGSGAPAPLGVDPPWNGHDNVAFVRVHARGASPATGVSVRGKVVSPAAFDDYCGTKLPGSTTHLPPIPPQQDATAAFHWKAPKTGSSYSVLGESIAGNGTVAAANGVAFTDFGTGLPATQKTTLKVGLDKHCPESRVFHVQPVGTGDGFSVAVSPATVRLAPGKHAKVTVSVTAPAGVGPGFGADLPLEVSEERPDADAALPAGAQRECTQFSFCGSTGHEESIGTFNVLARVVGPPATVRIACPSTAVAGQPLTINGGTSISGGNVVVESTAPNGKKVSALATRNGADFSAGFTPKTAGQWSFVARYGGDGSHAPSESARCIIIVT